MPRELRECAQANAFDLMRAARAAEVIPDVLAREMIYGVDGVFTKEPSLCVCVLSLLYGQYVRAHNDIIHSPSDDVCVRKRERAK